MTWVYYCPTFLAAGHQLAKFPWGRRSNNTVQLGKGGAGLAGPGRVLPALALYQGNLILVLCTRFSPETKLVVSALTFGENNTIRNRTFKYTYTRTYTVQKQSFMQGLFFRKQFKIKSDKTLKDCLIFTGESYVCKVLGNSVL